MEIYNLTKKFFDIVIAAFLIILVSPICLILAIVIKLSSPGKVLYWSQRIGKDNIPFSMPKFRTMQSFTPIVATHLLNNPEQYLIKFKKFHLGSWLRRTSLDELPQLWSILCGHMSFIGPRPALYNQHDLIKSRTTKDIHTIRPGLTGWAQVNGRDNLSIQEKTLLDQEYLLNRSIKLDLKILFKTIKIIFQRQGVAH